jgi:hypothetical protein
MAFFVLLLIITSVWVAVDASTIKRETGRQVAGSSAVGWMLGCIFLWIVVFPYYLIKRGNHGLGARTAPAAAPTSGCFCGGCGTEMLTTMRFCPGCGRPQHATVA